MRASRLAATAARVRERLSYKPFVSAATSIAAYQIAQVIIISPVIVTALTLQGIQYIP